MNWAVFLLLNLIFFNLGFQYQSLGRFMLIEVNQPKDTSSKSETKLGMMEKCLKEEGIPDICLNSFKNGEGYERCNSWLEKNHAMVMKSEARMKKCTNDSVLDRARRPCCPKPCPQKCLDCDYCMILFPVFILPSFVCYEICEAANCPGTHSGECDE